MSEDQLQMLLGSSVMLVCFSFLQFVVTSFILYALGEWKWERRKAANE